MCNYFFGGFGFRGFGMFNVFGNIFGIVLLIVAVLFAIKLAKDIFFGYGGKKDTVAKI
jgi:hypothetical protein